ncbi:hypothetical protein KH5_13800 [Urechidicola sp. KH5]
MEDTKSQRKIVVGILLLLLVSLGVYTIYQNNQLNASNNFLEEEKVTIQNNLDEMVAKYDAAIAENSELSEELKLEREDIILLRDSVKNLRSTNYSIIKRYRSKIEDLEASNKELFRLNDSLRIATQILEQDLESAEGVIATQNSALDSINSQNETLNGKVAVGAQLQANSLIVSTLKEKSSGKMVETTRANRTDALRIQFTIAENALTEAATKQVQIQLLNPKGEVLNIVGNSTTSDGTNFDYSDATSVDYANKNQDVISLIKVDRKEMQKGTHTVNIYLEDRLVAVGGFVLK